MESLYDTKALGRKIDTSQYSTDTLHELRGVLVEEIQGIEAQLSSSCVTQFIHPDQFREWKGKAIGAKTIKLGQLRQIKREISSRHNEQHALPLEESVRILADVVLDSDLDDDEQNALNVVTEWLAIRAGRLAQEEN